MARILGGLSVVHQKPVGTKNIPGLELLRSLLCHGQMGRKVTRNLPHCWRLPNRPISSKPTSSMRSAITAFNCNSRDSLVLPSCHPPTTRHFQIKVAQHACMDQKWDSSGERNWVTLCGMSTISLANVSILLACSSRSSRMSLRS